MLTLIPAYGRDYESAAEVESDFEEDKDFRIADISSAYNGSYANKSDLQSSEVSSVKIRYKDRMRATIIDL